MVGSSFAARRCNAGVPRKTENPSLTLLWSGEFVVVLHQCVHDGSPGGLRLVRVGAVHHVPGSLIAGRLRPRPLSRFRIHSIAGAGVFADRLRQRWNSVRGLP